MKKIFFFITVAFLSTSIFAQTTWKVDPMHSQLSFSIVHLGISDIDGVFNKFDVTVVKPNKDFSDAVFTLNVDVASINTRVDMRDNHLRSDDFFDVKKYPTMTFKSISCVKGSGEEYLLTGNLTLHGITKTVSMKLWHRGTIEDAKTKKSTAGFQLTGVIKRSDFNLGSKFLSPMLSDEVQIKADGEFKQQP